jgi:hypothetical protein
LFFEKHRKNLFYSSTSKTLARTLLFPPVGSASTLPHTKQSTLVALLPNIICSFLHLGQRIFMNLLVDSRILVNFIPPEIDLSSP